MKTECRYRMVHLAPAAAALLFALGGAPTAYAKSAEKGEARQSAAKKSAQKPAPQAPAGPSLYERVGGVRNVAVLLDDVIERSYASEVFRANPRIHEAHQRLPKAVYKYHATSLACMAMGGPEKYTGRSVKEAHQHLQITEGEWQELLKIFRTSMDAFRVGPKEQAEIVAILEGSRADVVMNPTQSASK